MKKGLRTCMSLIMFLCILSFNLPDVLAHGERGVETPTDSKMVVPVNNVNDKYSPNDIKVINNIIMQNGLKANINDPSSWSFVKWNEEKTRQIIELNLDEKNLKGSLNVTGLSALKVLYCGRGQLTGLDASGLTSLEKLYCDSNDLISLKLEGASALTQLFCYSNQLKNLDVSHLPSLTKLSCNNNQLTSLKLGSLTSLNDLDCSNNKLTSLDITGLSDAFVSLEGNLALRELTDPSGNTLTISKSKTGFAAVTSVECGRVKVVAYARQGYMFNGWNIGSRDNPLNLTLTGNMTVKPNFTGETEPVFNPGDLAFIQKIIKDCQLDGKNSIMLEYPDTYTYVAKWDQKAVTGKRLTELSIYGLGLTGELDVSGLSALKDIYCENNQLTSLNLSGQNDLEYLSCDGNPLSEITFVGGKSVKLIVAEGGGRPWLEEFDYNDGQPNGLYSADPAPGYGNPVWSNLIGCTLTGDGEMNFDFEANGEDSVSAQLTFTRTVALNADPDSIEITGKGIYEGMRVRRGKTVTFTANPAETGAPEPFTGDIRYEPVKWKVNPSGDFKTGYTQSFSTKDMALGDHTLKVIYNQERYNGNAWKETGESVDKTLNFILEGDEAITHPQSSTPQGNSGNPKVKASGIPQTGDSGFGLYLIALVFTASLMLLLLKNILRWRRSV